MSGGDAAGSKFWSIRVGVPDRPAIVDICQNPLTLTKWATTSCAVQPSQRDGVFHSSALRSVSILAMRFRWRTTGTS